MSEQVDGLSRRSVLKRIGAGAAVAWSAPAILSIGAARAAGSSVCQAGIDYLCGNDPGPSCGAAVAPPNPPPGFIVACVCDSDSNGDPFCWNNFLCSTQNACTSNADCQSGHACVTSCCGRTCAPACGSALVAAGAGDDGSSALG